jgi:hypothetical protein
VPKNPLPRHHVDTCGTSNQRPCVILH